MIDSENLPQAYIYNAQRNVPVRPQIVRPDFEPELLDYFNELEAI